MLILTISEVLNFDFSEFEQLLSPKIAKNDIFGPFEFAKTVFHVKLERR